MVTPFNQDGSINLSVTRQIVDFLLSHKFEFLHLPTSSPLANKKPAHGRLMDYPAQRKPPLEPQLLPAEVLDPPVELPSEAKTESFFFVFFPSQAGQTWAWSASAKRTIFSNSFPQSVH